MKRPHGHHILPKKGKGSQKQLVNKGINLLEFYNIDWYKGTGADGNLIHAPNVAGLHTTRVVKKLYQELQAVHERNINRGLTWQQGRMMMAEQLQKAGKQMATGRY